MVVVQPVYAYGSGMSYTSFSYSTRNLSAAVHLSDVEAYIAHAQQQHKYIRLDAPECELKAKSRVRDVACLSVPVPVQVLVCMSVATPLNLNCLGQCIHTFCLLCARVCS